jgi:hypothetical protein
MPGDTAAEIPHDGTISILIKVHAMAVAYVLSALVVDVVPQASQRRANIAIDLMGCVHPQIISLRAIIPPA